MRRMIVVCCALLAGCASPGQDAAQPASSGKTAADGERASKHVERGEDRAVVNFADLPHRIDDWQADGTHGIFLRVGLDDWYYASFMGPCHELPFAETVGIVTDGLGQVDKFSSILVERAGGGLNRCWFKNFTRVAGPDAEPKGLEDRSG